MEAVALRFVSPSLITHHPHRCRSLCSTSSSSSSFPIHSISIQSRRNRWRWRSCAKRGGGDEEKKNEEEEEDEVSRALGMDGSIPGSSAEFLRHVSSRAYDMRRHLNQTPDPVSYDVLETNPWRDELKPVYVLTHKDNQLCTMKTRQNRSEVERELGLLFSKGGKRGLEMGNKTKQSRAGTEFSMFVEDIRDGVLETKETKKEQSREDRKGSLIVEQGTRAAESIQV